jgi:hypothetical protein
MAVARILAELDPDNELAAFGAYDLGKTSTFSEAAAANPHLDRGASDACANSERGSVSH